MTPSHDPNSIAGCVLDTFDTLQPRYKPRTLPHRQREWVPLAGIVLSRGHVPDASTKTLTCAALATGMKCLPQSKVTLAEGNVLHDWHAEVLAIRAFNTWLVGECADLARRGSGSDGAWLRWSALAGEHAVGSEEGGDTGSQKELPTTGEGRIHEPRFALKDNVSIHMYCSEAPCGDASMELTMAEQDDATPWVKQPAISPETGEMEMLGRGNFDRLGIVRRKPARPDAPLSWSKSCTDKMALKQCTGLLSGLTSLLIHPKNVYLLTLVLPESQCVPHAVERAFGANGRMAPMVGKQWSSHGYAFKPFEVHTTSREFAYSRRGTTSLPTPSNLSCLYTHNRQEVLINGALQGRKQFDPRGASSTSRRTMWKSVLDVAILAGLPALERVLRKRCYADVKKSDELQSREMVKRNTKDQALKGWKQNTGDDGWDLQG
ncbi:hypothetical protein DOTSEDRAFT_58742 [Dothistroma septosporum NZE10]|uniref:A to I editase domain-containing protein n=1 Tax=Dothistroma septosporum (strain NZE10 / CBS 128990) TaxID=675120 RepID=N1Q466_DOTSN|nr:hypothetical protein DOTSEDRAFT_58742 [Dothistroma septosporum NZE10]